MKKLLAIICALSTVSLMAGPTFGAAEQAVSPINGTPAVSASPVNGNSSVDASTTTSGSTSYEGSVSQVTSDGFVMTTRYGSRTITVKTSSDTSYVSRNMLLPRDLNVGDKVYMSGTVEKSDNTIAVRLIYVSPNGFANAQRAGGAKKRAGITGTIASLQPPTVTGDDGQTYNVKYTGRMLIMEPGVGNASDIAVGKGVRVIGVTNGDTSNEIVTATKITLINGGGRGRAGKKLKKLRPNPATAVAQ